jgi:1-acyl-sn-glycerol-3-phosphate acyltransferase
MADFFLSIYRFFSARKRLFYLVFLASFLGLSILASRIHFDENVMQMLPHQQRLDELSQFLQSSKFTDRVVICVSDIDSTATAVPEQQAAYADKLAATIMHDESQHVTSLTYHTNDSLMLDVLGTISENLPIFLEAQDYAAIDSAIAPRNVMRKVAANYEALVGPTGIALKPFIAADPLGFGYVVLNKLKDFKPDDKVDLFEGHFFTADRRHLFIFLEPRYSSANTAQNQIFFEQLDHTLTAHSSARYQATYFGAPAVAAANARQIRHDTYLTLSISVVSLIVVILLFFRRLSAPILMLLPVVFGGLFALAFVAATQESVSIIAIGAGSVILGIAVNYSLHYLTHFRYHPDPEGTIRDLAFPLTIGSLTTIAGFLCLQFVDVPVLHDLGLFAGLSLIGAAICTLVFLPHFATSRNSVRVAVNATPNFYSKLRIWSAEFYQYRVVRYSILGLTPLLLYYSLQVRFESDMNRINFMTPQLRKAEALLNRVSTLSRKTVFLTTKGTSLDEALRRNEQLLPKLNALRTKGEILRYSGPLALLPSQTTQQGRIARWNAYWTPAKKQQLLASLTAAGRPFNFSSTAFQPVDEMLNRSYNPLSIKTQKLLRKVLLNNFIEEKNGQVYILNLLTTTPESTRSVFKILGNTKHSYIFDRQYITHSLVSIVNQEFTFIAFWTSTLVFVALLLSYGRIELALISFLPMVVAWVWILGLMAIFNIKFNIINIILSTLVFALGDDYCIFTMDGLQRDYAEGRHEENSVSISIMLSALTTVIGLGTLFMAKHPALQSMAFVSIIGIFCVWFVSQTLQPYLFSLLITRPAQRRQAPYTFWGLIKSVFAFGYFVLGALLLNILGLLLKIVPAKRSGKKYIFHWVISKFTGSLIYIMANVKKTFINDQSEDFSKPAVIIANHQSFLDILLLTMQHPKLVLLTSDWVWNSPVFGAVVRMADYFPASQGAETGLAALQAQVAAGYSVVIFPEGTRSADGRIRRFHKGAFFLADKLGLDVLPILIHGSGDTMRKGHFYLNDGQMTVKILPRIKVENKAFGSDYSTRAKLVSQYFRREYTQLAQAAEQPDYYKNELIANYLYKGPVLEWYTLIKMRLEGYYQLFDGLLPRRGRILDIGCGYGFMTNMLALTSPEREVTGFDFDEEKITVAQHGFVNGSNVSFTCANALTAPLAQYDGIVLSDVLHYLPDHEQQALLQKCYQSLRPEGVIVIRDGFKELADRHKGTMLTEWFSTRFCRFNKTAEGGLVFPSTELVRNFAVRNQLDLSLIDNTRYTSNLVFVCRRPA